MCKLITPRNAKLSFVTTIHEHKIDFKIASLNKAWSIETAYY